MQSSGGSPLDRLRALCLTLPEAHEAVAWGEPTFRVRNRLFAMYASAESHHGGGRPAVWLRRRTGESAPPDRAPAHRLRRGGGVQQSSFTRLTSPAMSMRFVMLLCAVAATPLAAQTAVVTGTVRDSLAGQPFAGAFVQLVPQDAPGMTPRTVQTDSAGRFVIADVAPGHYLLGFLHQRLDSLGLQVPARVLDVPVGSATLHADLALPSAVSIAGALCGVRHDTTGVLIGRVLDARTGDPAPAGAVSVSWSELGFNATGIHRMVRQLHAPIGDDGRYAACGVPTDIPVLVHATTDSAPATGTSAAGTPSAPTGASTDSASPLHGASGSAESGTEESGTIAVRFAANTPVRYRDLFVAPSGGTVAAHADSAGANGPVSVRGARRGAARLTGHVLQPNGSPLAGARVTVHGARAADSAAVSGADGTFHLDALPGGTYPVEAVAIGYTPAAGAADLRPGHPATLDLTLGTRVKTLEKVSIYAAPLNANSEFARHRRTESFGRFLTAKDIETRSPRFVGDALISVPGLHLGGSTRTGAPIVLGRGGCLPEVFLDGMYVARDPSFDRGALPVEAFVNPAEIGGIEVYPDATTAPAQYARPFSDCAVVVVWTKGRVQ